MSKYTEDSLVQQTTANYLKDQLGWNSVYAYKNEDFGKNSLLGRSSEREVVLVRYLRQKLVELNPDLPEAAYEDAIRTLTETVASQALAQTNREKHDLIRNGVQVTFRNDKGERVRDRLKVIDFDNAENNHFLCVRELVIKGDLYRRRADIVGFVNGLPLLFMECKNLHKNLRNAYDTNFSDYKDTVPHLFHHNAVVMFGNGDKAKVGSVTAKWEYFHDWKRLHEEEPGVVDMETALKGVCNKKNFIDLFENFILFDESSGAPVKILARNHQFLGVNLAVESVSRREELEGKLGVFWHTQGAGKSYSMVMFSQKVRRKLGGNFTFLVLTDRTDLDAQIYKTFAGCGVVNNDKDPCRASSGKRLNALLGQHKSYVFSLIQKFNAEVDPDDPYTQREDIIVMTDEAHRTQYGTLALNLRNALPNASYMGFTGTPLFSDDEVTRKVFGEYVSTYDFQRAVEDGATVPLYYDARGDKLGISIGDLNERIANKVEELETDDIDVSQRLESELKRDYHVITAHKRLDQVASDFVDHYSRGWETGKAMLVCIDKVTCVRMFHLIEEHWNKQIAELEKQKNKLDSAQEELVLARRIEWMRETRAAVVVSEEQGEVDRFKKWDLDIKPHRKLIKDGIDLPEALRKRPEYQSMQRMALDDAFKEDEHPFRIVIVCAMWLTGFDVPSLSTLYLDKPLKAHTLMQAMARANRVHAGKNNGLIVDYCGVLMHLRKALATYAGTQADGGSDEIDPARPDEELLADLVEAIQMAKGFLNEKDAPLEAIRKSEGFARNAAILACKEAVNENDESRKRFEIVCRAVFKKFKACSNIREVNAHRADRDGIDIVYRSLQSDKEKADISHIIRELHKIVDDAVHVDASRISEESAPYDISKIDFDRLKAEFEHSPAKKTTVQNLRQAIENRLKQMLMENPLRTDFQDHYETLVAEYNREKDRLTIEKTFEALIKFVGMLDEEEHRAVGEGLNQEYLALFDLLKKPELKKNEVKRIKAVAIGLLDALKAEKLSIDHWRAKEATRDAIRQAIHDYLWSDETGLPEAYNDNDIAEIAEAVYRHIHWAYPKLPSPIYGVA